MAGYIGSKVAVVSSGAERKKIFTATSGQTSFTGLSYTVNNVHVFQNGVRLVDGTDYTATNGNSITLTVGAATDDQVVVVSYNTFQTSDTVSASTGGTFAGDVNFTGAFTSQGIDDNASSTAMTLDGSGNLLVGKTVTSSNTAGGRLSNIGSAEFTRSGGQCLYLNRQSSDGTIASFAKDGTTVGSIGYISSGLYIDGEGGHAGLRFGGADISPRDGGADADAAIQLGSSSNRFTDLYLSGGVYLGGTGSANLLDDYEEGTWTPSLNSGTFSTVGATYTKIGRLVTITLDGTVGTGGGDQITNLPFTTGVTTATALYTSGQNFSSGRTVPMAIVGGGSTTLYFRDIGDNVAFAAMTLTASASITFNITYYVN
jgi:hypothetical protein